MFFKKNHKLLDHFGYHQEVMPVVSKALTGFILRISENSSNIFLSIWDIASENFTKINVYDLINGLPEHLSFENSEIFLNKYISPFVSDNFTHKIRDDQHELLLTIFFQYFMVRLPALFKFGRFIDWPDYLGPNYEDLKEIAICTAAIFEELYPSGAKKIFGPTTNSTCRVFYKFAEGKELANKHKFKDKEMQKFIFNCKEVFHEISEIYPKIQWNVYIFLEVIFERNFQIFWDYFKSDYMDTLQHWYYAGGFVDKGSKKLPSDIFWPSLDKRIDRYGNITDNK